MTYFQGTRMSRGVDVAASDVNSSRTPDDENATMFNDSLLPAYSASISNDTDLALATVGSIFDETNLTAAVAQSILNSTNLSRSRVNDIKTNVTRTFDIWVSGDTLPDEKYETAGCGTQTAGLAIGGSGSTSSTEEYNGYSWSSGGNLLYYKYRHDACGTQTAGLQFGGYGGGIKMKKKLLELEQKFMK